MHPLPQNFFSHVTKFGTFMLIAAVASVLAMMILPLPTFMMDLLLAINLMAAMTLLLVAISVSNSLQIAAFPTLLLLATLFRLGLNISSTRLILTQGYAGNIIETFGHFVTGGNLVVGLIMFAILTVIQFLVIAKGSERVAEVAARFTLDALPGKQMSIDADLRSGLIGQTEAKSLREDLQKESRMYGAMDGAMKFVKGDAIAGVLITAINILGGLFSGIAQRGMDLGTAINTYSKLAVGDGLVSQIPALLVSITAGIIVTRVADTENKNSLGKDIGLQIFAHPKALLVAAGLSIAIGMIPGLPLFFFSLVALGLGGTAIFLIQSAKKKAMTPTPVEAYLVDAERQMLEHVGQAIPLSLEVGEELYRHLKKDPRWTHCFGNLYPRLKLHLSNQIGVLFPELKITLNKDLRNSFRYQIRIWDVPVDYGIMNPEHCALIGQPGPNFEEPGHTTETVHGTPIQLYQIQKKNALEQKGINTFGPEEMFLRHLARVLKKHAGDFIGIQEVHNLLNRVEMNFPELVREVVPKMMTIQKLTEVIKRLVEEDVPIKDFRLILQTLSTCQPEEKDPVTLTEQVRVGLKRTLTFMYAEDGERLNAFTLDPEIEEEIRKAIRRQGQECYLVLPPERLNTLGRTLQHSLARSRGKARRPVILTQLELRRYVRKIIENVLPHTPVLSFQELDPKVVIHPLGTIHNPYEAQTVVVAS